MKKRKTRRKIKILYNKVSFGLVGWLNGVFIVYQPLRVIQFQILFLYI